MANNLLDGIAGEVLKDPEAKNAVLAFLGLDQLVAQLKRIEANQLGQNKVLNQIAAALTKQK